MSNNKINTEKHIILSRKGFDSAAGGNASIIIDVNGKKYIQPLPIPDPHDTLGGITYADIKPFVDEYKNLNILMEKANINPMLKGHNNPIYTCHKDPDIFADTKKAAFGQMGTAEAHLKNNNIDDGDLFLFFGWYKCYKLEGKEIIRQKDAECDDKHVLYGYLYVDKVYDLTDDEEFNSVPEVYHNHPHYRKQKIDNTIKNNRLYVAKEYIPGTDIPGFGVFDYDEELILSKEGMPKSRWRIDEGSFMSKIVSEGRKMTYHNDNSICREGDYFQSAARGQEFVINPSDDEEFRQDIYDFISRHRKK